MSGIVTCQFLLEAAMSFFLIYQSHNVAIAPQAREFAVYAALILTELDSKKGCLMPLKWQ